MEIVLIQSWKINMRMSNNIMLLFRDSAYILFLIKLV